MFAMPSQWDLPSPWKCVLIHLLMQGLSALLSSITPCGHPFTIALKSFFQLALLSPSPPACHSMHPAGCATPGELLTDNHQNSDAIQPEPYPAKEACDIAGDFSWIAVAHSEGICWGGLDRQIKQFTSTLMSS